MMALLMQQTCHGDAINLLITADRRSLNNELNDTRAEVQLLRRQLKDAEDKHAVDQHQAEQLALTQTQKGGMPLVISCGDR